MYQGHMNDGSSIQKHSAGPLYPFVVYETHGGDMLLMAPRGNAIRVSDRRIAEAIVRRTRSALCLRRLSPSQALDRFAGIMGYIVETPFAN